MITSCQACGVSKDMDALEELECQPRGDGGFRLVRVCHQCMHKLNPDMWIRQGCWESLNPATKFEDLPLV